jgi:hypothetical protein
VSLDLAKIVTQVSDMVTRLKDGLEERQECLQYALDTISRKAVDLEGLKKKIAASRTTWLVADLVDGLADHYGAPSLPDEFTVIATDGSHIDVNRHHATRCYLINIGSAVIGYGAEPDATLKSFPHLYSNEEDLVITSSNGKGREPSVEGTLLGIKRGVAECRQLAELAAVPPPGSTSLALLDGTLILWGLEAYPEFVTEAMLDKGFLTYLEDMRKLNRDRKLALASYISFPRSTDVINTLRVAICPYEPADCDRYCPPGKERNCEATASVRDRELFLSLLSPGERSARFISQSSVVRKHYGEHRVYFFYLRVDDEIARVEVPSWVAQDESLLELTHALVLDQCRRGHGYPVALSEAHEQAVVTGADREEFWYFVESSLVAAKIPTLSSAKSFSKRTRWV